MQREEYDRRLLLRTPAMAADYAAALATEKPQGGCRLCADTETLREFNHWRIMRNRFPYDRYYSVSDMLTLKRHATEPELSPAERQELSSLKASELGEQYDQLLENLPQQTSIPHHYHLHLVVIRPPFTVTETPDHG